MQATVKQVQFLEIVEEKSGVPYTGQRWDIEEVSAYLDANSKQKRQSSDTQNNGYVNRMPKNNKITDKQKQYIKVLENKTGVFFSGKTFEDAEAYIKANKAS